jgi:hypothetical protein
MEECNMFGLLAMPMISNLIGSALGGLFGGQGSHGCHGHHHHHHHDNNLREAAQDFRMAREDFRDAQQDFARGDFFGGMRELSEAQEHYQDGLSHLQGGRGWI